MNPPSPVPDSEHLLHEKLQQATQLWQQGQALAQAAALVAEVVAQAPAQAPLALNALHLQAQMAMQQGQPATALAALHELRRRRPQLPPSVLLLLAQAARACGEWAEAVAVLTPLAEDPALAPELRLAVWLELGHSCLLQGEAETALGRYRAVLVLAPEHPEARLGEGNALLEQGLVEAAQASYQALLAQQPEAVAARLNLATALVQQGVWAEARQQLLLALRQQPPQEAAHFRLMTLAAEPGFATALAINAEPELTLPEEGATKLLSVIVCSIDDARFTQVAQMYAERLAGRPYELIRIADARSLCEGYQRGLAQSRGEWVIFSHDDIAHLAPDFDLRLRRHLLAHEVVGVAGTTCLRGGMWGSAGWPHQHGWVAHTGKTPGTLELNIFRVDGPLVTGIQALDGLFMAARREVALAIGFDAQTFDGFHFYDLDFSYRAYLAGYRLVVANDLPVLHFSRGNFDARWQGYAERFQAKHQATLSRLPAQSGGAVHLEFADAAAALAYCRQVLRLLA